MCGIRVDPHLNLNFTRRALIFCLRFYAYLFIHQAVACMYVCALHGRTVYALQTFIRTEISSFISFPIRERFQLFFIQLQIPPRAPHALPAAHSINYNPLFTFLPCLWLTRVQHAFPVISSFP